MEIGLLTWIAIGFVAGTLAKLFMPGSDPGGCVVTIVIGIVGALIGGFVVRQLGASGVSGFNLWSILVATLGSIILLAIYRAIAGRRV